MTSPTHGDGSDERPTDAPDDDSGSRAVSAGPPSAERGTDTSSQASGKQFERGTESVPDHDPETGTGGLGPGASASGKRFARGTDSDGDGVAYDEGPGSGT